MLFLPDQQLPGLIELLKTFGDFHGPTFTSDGVLVFAPVADADQLQLDYRRTLIPPKKYVLPPRDTTLTWAPESGYRTVSPPDQITVLFGIHPCDIAGLAYLDGVFLSPTDPNYAARRSRLILVGLSCEPDEYCFCRSRECTVDERGDLFLERMQDGYYLSSGTELGEEILAKAIPLTEERQRELHERTASEEYEMIHSAVARGESFEDSPLWRDFALRCLSCGACSLCCPTCYCFDVQEYIQLDGETSDRIRDWDNCLFRAHGEVAGGQNFRPRRQDRFRYRFQHKYLGFGPTRGVVSCVGCGRCREVCPVGIDLLRLFHEGKNDG